MAVSLLFYAKRKGDPKAARTTLISFMKTKCFLIPLFSLLCERLMMQQSTFQFLKWSKFEFLRLL